MSVPYFPHLPFRSAILPGISTTFKTLIGQLCFYLAGIFTQQLSTWVSFDTISFWQKTIGTNDKQFPPFVKIGGIFNVSSEQYSASHLGQWQPQGYMLLQAFSSNVSIAGSSRAPKVLNLTSFGAEHLSLGSVHWFLACLAISLVVLKSFQAVKSSLNFRAFSNENACLPIRIAPNPFPWKLRRYFELSKIDANLLDDYLLKKFQSNGLTHGLATVFTKKVKAIATIEPLNFQAVLATKFEDWERPKFRAGAAKPFLKVGILTLVC
jgi:hypothetical protein